MRWWTIIQFGLLLLCYIVAYLLYRDRAWRAGFPFTVKSIKTLIFVYLTPIVWLILCLALGLSLLIFDLRQSNTIYPLISLVVFPAVVLIFLGVILWNKQSLTDRLEHEENKLIENKTYEFVQWTKQFEFLREDMYEIKMYISNGKPVGKAYIRNITKEQAKQLAKSKQSIPVGLYLDFETKPVDNNNKFFH